MDSFNQQDHIHHNIHVRPDDPFLAPIAPLPLASSEPAATTPSSSLQAQVGPADSSPGPSHDSHDQPQLAQSPFGPHPTLSLLNEIPSSIVDSRSIAGMLDPRPRGYPSHKVFDMLTGAGPAPGAHHMQSQRSADRPNPSSIPRGLSIGAEAAEDPNQSGGLEGPSSSIMVGLNHKDHRYKSTIQPDEPGNSDDEDSGSPSPSLIRHHPHHQQAPGPGPFRRDAPAPSHLPTSTAPVTQSILHEHRPSVAPNPAASKPFFNQVSFLVRAREAWNQERRRYSRLIETDGQIPLDDVEGQTRLPVDDSRQKSRLRTSTLNTREVALWRWVNLDDLDAFLQEVYGYYCGKGIWAIGLSRLCDLMTIGFVGSFTTFLMGCIDYSTLRRSHHLNEVITPRCLSKLSGLTSFLVLCFGIYYAWKVLEFSNDIAKLWQMHQFFTHLLEVSEVEIQTIPWHGLVDKLAALKNQHPSSHNASEHRGGATPPIRSVLQRKLDAHDVANQIMREQNYLIALFNKDVLDLRPPLPNWMSGNALVGDCQLTTSLEWNLLFCLRGYLLDQRGQVKYEFLNASNKIKLAAGLRKRFVKQSIVNGLLAPFIVIYVLLYSFFRYFEEYHQNPSSIGSRKFSKLAEWKFREYNELPHLFRSRLTKSYSISKQYVDQFPKTKTSILAKFVSFVAGSFAAILILLSIFDPDAFLHFQITTDRSVLFYIGLFGSILAISRGMIPKDYEGSIESPEVLMQQIVQHTHYLPTHWYGKLHSLEIYTEFCELFQLRVVNFLREVMSVFLTPFILWHGFTDERCERIIDFFREFTIHVDGIGHVCSFAVFDFSKLGNGLAPQDLQLNLDGTHNPARQDSPASRLTPARQPQQQHDITKMERSLLSFVAHNPNWEPSNQTASLYLSKAIGFSAADSVLYQSGVHPHQAFPPGLQRRPTRMIANSILSPSNGPMAFGARSRFMNPNLVHGQSAIAGLNSMFVGSSGGRGQAAVHPHGTGSSSSPHCATSVAPSRRLSAPNQVAINAGGQPTNRASQAMMSNSKVALRRITSGAVGGGLDRRPMMGVEAIDEEECEEQPNVINDVLTDNAQKKWAGLDEADDDEDPFGVMASEIGADGLASTPVVLTKPAAGDGTGSGAGGAI